MEPRNSPRDPPFFFSIWSHLNWPLLCVYASYTSLVTWCCLKWAIEIYLTWRDLKPESRFRLNPFMLEGSCQNPGEPWLTTSHVSPTHSLPHTEITSADALHTPFKRVKGTVFFSSTISHPWLKKQTLTNQTFSFSDHCGILSLWHQDIFNDVPRS